MNKIAAMRAVYLALGDISNYSRLVPPPGALRPHMSPQRIHPLHLNLQAGTVVAARQPRLYGDASRLSLRAAWPIIRLHKVPTYVCLQVRNTPPYRQKFPLHYNLCPWSPSLRLIVNTVDYDLIRCVPVSSFRAVQSDLKPSFPFHCLLSALF